MNTVISSGEIAAIVPANSTSGAFALAEGFTDITTLTAAGYGIIPLGVCNSGPTSNSYPGARLRFFGTGADNSTFDYRLWLYTASGDGKGYLTYFGGGSVTLSTLAGLAGTPVPVLDSAIGTANRIADTLSFTLSSAATTPVGPWTDIYTALVAPSPSAYSPVGNKSAFLIVPEFGSATYLIAEFDLTGATSANVAVEKLA